MKLLEGKVAIITGGSRGIGRGIAKIFAQQGANVAFTYSSSVTEANQLEDELKTFGVKVKGYQSNAADFNQCEQLVEEVVKDFGTVDILINNAGITKDTLLMRMSEEDFDKVIQVNLKSVFNMTKAAQKIMLKQRKGSIINISSVVGVQGNAGQANIAPGFIETEMTAALKPEIVEGWRNAIPLKRGGQPEDVANACVFLASDLSSYITGQVLRVDGGMITA